MKIFKNETFLVLLGVLLCWSAISHAQATAVSSKTQWRLTDIDGVEHNPFDDESTHGIVLVFISTDCPIANSYHPLLRRMAESHAQDGIRFFMVHPDPKTPVEGARKHSEQFEIQVPVVIDKDQAISRRIGATVTPQVFVLVRGEESPVYQGRIDDLYVDFGKKRTAATTHDLADAIKAIVSGKTISQKETKPIGCFISFMQAPPETLPTKKSDYDPLSVDRDEVKKIELTVMDQDRSREIPLLVYLPKNTEPAAVILHSHGLGGTRMTSTFLGNHWGARGYAAVFLQHPGSDDSVWKDSPPLRRMAEVRKAASAENFTLRVKDVPAVIDQLETWNQDKKHSLFGRLDLKRIGMSGHSFGAVTTQNVAGQSVLGSPKFTDQRIRAAIPMSPSSPQLGDPKKAFANVKIPWMCLTGTKDTSPIGNADVESRLAVYSSLPGGNKYELVLDGAEHSVFTERALPGEKESRNPNHHRAILAVTTAFWDTFLRDDPDAKIWLNGSEVLTILDPKDRWQKK